jgi:hypothetical protein
MIDGKLFMSLNFDKYCKPVIYMRPRHNHPNKTTDRQLMQYMLWTMRRIEEVMHKHIDNYLLIYDLKGAGWSNFSVQQMTRAVKGTGVS